MKHYLLPVFLVTAFLVGSCSFMLPVAQQPTPHWYLQHKEFSSPAADMRMQISSADMAGNHIRLFVHVTDTQNFHYRGIPAAAFCSPSITYNGNTYPIKDYKVTEYRDLNRDSTAYAFVLDHSSSMGNAKYNLYLITRQLLQNKREQDAYAIIRYADESLLDVPLSSDKQTLLDQFKPGPHQYIGSHTATWDGLVEGVAALETSSYNLRTLVVFTDGGENVSKVSREWAFWRAKTAGVKVVAISLGTDGIQNMQALCESTGGMYLPIQHISQASYAFTDMENKTGSFYQVDFETPIIGKQTVQLNLCNMGMQAGYTFNNEPAGTEPGRAKQPETAQASVTRPSSSTTPDTAITRPSSPSTASTSTGTSAPPRPTPTVPQWPVRINLPGGPVSSPPTTVPTRAGTSISNGGRTGTTGSAPRR